MCIVNYIPYILVIEIQKSKFFILIFFKSSKNLFQVCRYSLNGAVIAMSFPRVVTSSRLNNNRRWITDDPAQVHNRYCLWQIDYTPEESSEHGEQ